MTGQETRPGPPRNLRVSRRERDLLAAGLMVAGAAGVMAAAWLWHPLAGFAVTSAVLFACGVVFGME